VYSIFVFVERKIGKPPAVLQHLANPTVVMRTHSMLQPIKEVSIIKQWLAPEGELAYTPVFYNLRGKKRACVVVGWHEEDENMVTLSY
jgi:hypothetical protein